MEGCFLASIPNRSKFELSRYNEFLHTYTSWKEDFLREFRSLGIEPAKLPCRGGCWDGAGAKLGLGMGCISLSFRTPYSRYMQRANTSIKVHIHLN